MENITQKLAWFSDSASSSRLSMDALLKAYEKFCNESRENAGDKYFQTIYPEEEVTYEYVDKDFNRKEFKKRNDFLDGYRYNISVIDEYEYAFPATKSCEMKMIVKKIKPELSFNEFMGFDEENK